MRENGRGGKANLLARGWRRLWNSPRPTLGCEISQEGIVLGRWSAQSSDLETVTWKPVSDGAVVASPLRENLQRPEEVRQAFAAALDSLGMASRSSSPERGAELAMVIPDQAARLFVLSFDTFPQRSPEALALVKWRLKKSLPFDVETAALSCLVERQGGELQVVAVAAPQWIIRQYEALAESFGLRPRCVTLSTLASLGLVRTAQLEAAGVPASSAEGSEAASRRQTGILVARYSAPWFTIAILQQGYLRLFRTVGLGSGEDRRPTPAEVLEAREDKPITKLATTVTRQDGVVVLEGTAVCYTMNIAAR